MFFGATTGHAWLDLIALYGVAQVPMLYGLMYAPELWERALAWWDGVTQS